MPGSDREPKWFNASQIISLNEKVVAQRGEAHLVLSQALLESAIARPKNLFRYENETDVFALGLRLLEALGKNHCFEQGNKRTAFVAAVSFMTNNGAKPHLVDTFTNAKTIRRFITGAYSSDQMTEWCRVTASLAA